MSEMLPAERAAYNLDMQWRLIRELQFCARRLTALREPRAWWRRWVAGLGVDAIAHLQASNNTHIGEAYKVLDDFQFEYDLLKDGKTAAEVNRAIRKVGSDVTKAFFQTLSNKRQVIQGLAKALDQSLPYNEPTKAPEST